MCQVTDGMRRRRMRDMFRVPPSDVELDLLVQLTRHVAPGDVAALRAAMLAAGVNPRRLRPGAR